MSYTIKSCGKHHAHCKICSPDMIVIGFKPGNIFGKRFEKGHSRRHPNKTGRLLLLHDGYAFAYFLGSWKRAHRLAFVYYTAIYNIPSNWHVHHINGDKLDNRQENLELLMVGEHLRKHPWGSRSHAP